MKPKVIILILNWNGWQDTIECLESVFRTIYENYQVVVIDNGSTNDSVEKMREWAEGKMRASEKVSDSSVVTKPIPVVLYDAECAASGGTRKEEDRLAPMNSRFLVLVQAGANRGFAGGNNIGIRYALAHNADYVLLLNNDAFFRSPKTLSILVDFMERTARAGACGGRMSYPDGAPQQSYGHFPTVFRMLAALFPVYRLLPRVWLPSTKRSYVVPEGPQDRPVRIDWPSGACLMVRRSAIADTGLLDEQFFLYLEETDWCRRMSDQGWDRYFVPQAEIGHVFGGSVNKTSVSMRRHNLESQFIYLRKHFSRSARLVVAAGYIVRASGPLLLGPVAEAVLPHRRPGLQERREYWQAAYRLGIETLVDALSGGKRSRKGAGRSIDKKAPGHA